MSNTKKERAARRLPITEFAHKAGVVGDALMAAIAATLDVTAEGRGAAKFDRPHRPPPRGRQRRAVPVTKRRAEAAEHIRHFQPLASHGTRSSGGHEIRRGWQDDGQRFQRTGRGANLARGDHQVLRRGAQVTMTEQQLDGAQIGSGFEEMHRERVAQCVRGDRLADAAPPRDLPAGQIDGERMDMLAWRSAREQPLPGMGVARQSR